MVRVEITADAERDLDRLDKQVAARLHKRLKWLEENFERMKQSPFLGGITPEPLSGPLADLYKFRVGDFRVLYDILREDQVLVIHRIRHRREVYQEK